MLAYSHLDVFSKTPLSGNGLTVFYMENELDAELMLKITQEMRQFESIFLASTDSPQRYKARIFTMQEELAFAGHPVLGAACALHEKNAVNQTKMSWELELKHKVVNVLTQGIDQWYMATMEQGIPEFLTSIDRKESKPFLQAFNLSQDDLYEGLPLQVVSTGLSYLIIPLKKGLEKTRIIHQDLETLLAEIGAQFAYVFDVKNSEGRTWDNDGQVEDIATGSAAGPVGAYLVKYGLAQIAEDIIISQGRFVGRPSSIIVKVEGAADAINSVQVRGEVNVLGQGTLNI